MIKIKNQKSVVLWSHLFFLVPLTVALANQLYLYSLVIVVALLASYNYHLHPKSHWHLMDRLSALLLIASNFYLFVLTSFYSFYFLAALSFALVAFVFFFKASGHKYYRYHALWHLFSALITICSLAGYLAY